jgi:hypothetical protein
VIRGTVGNGACGTTSKNLTCYIFVSKPTSKSKIVAHASITFTKPKS